MPNNSKPNSLITEKSPYLLQHAHNPVTGTLRKSETLKLKQAGSCQHRLFDVSLTPRRLPYNPLQFPPLKFFYPEGMLYL
ncbi:uncharacterized protein S100072_04080 [Bacillus velezensis]|nr:uncharacterized protein S100072_04080 [Bacillus velezensis]